MAQTEFSVLKQFVDKCSKLNSENKNNASTDMTHPKTVESMDDQKLDTSQELDTGQTTTKDLKQTDNI